MPGVIEELAAETAEREAQEARLRERERADHDAGAAVREREDKAEARQLAMRAARGLTGRVIFPARWTFIPVDDHFRRCLRETIEGKVTIWVYTNGGYVERILVGNDEAGKIVEWKNPRWKNRPPSRWPTNPGRDWFRRALVELGVI